MNNFSPRITILRWLRSGSILARVLSATVVAVVLWAWYAPVPYMQHWQIHQVLTSIGIVTWPAAVLPWLDRRLSVRSRWVFGMFGVVAGYWLQGQPLFALAYEGILFNLKLLPYLGGAAVVLLGLVIAIDRQLAAGKSPWVSELSLAIALLWVVSSVLPIRAVANMKPETVAVPGLAISETYLLQVPGDSDLTGWSFEDVVVICGPDTLLWRFPDGTAKILFLSFNHRSLDIVENSGHVLILDKRSGILYCFQAATGDQVWHVDGLGTVNQIRWTVGAGWFLDHPEPGEFEQGRGTIRLHRVEVNTGSHTVWSLEPPGGLFWPEIPEQATSGSGGARLGLSGDWAFVRIGVWADPASPVAGSFTYLAIPGEAPDEPWLLMEIPKDLAPVGEIEVAGSMAVYLCFRNDRYELVARDIVTGQETWSLVIGGNSYGGRPLLALPDRVLLDYGSFMSSSRTDLVCLDPLTGREMWRFPKPRYGLRSVEGVGPRTLVLVDDPTPERTSKTDVILLGEDGEPVWRYPAKRPAYTVYVDPGKDRVVLLEGAGEQLPGSGWWGVETVIRLSDGQVERGGTATTRKAIDLGGCRYLLLDDMLYRSVGRFTGDYLANQAVMRLGGPGVRIVDAVRYTDNVLARPDMVVVACRTPEGVKVYVLRARK